MSTGQSQRRDPAPHTRGIIAPYAEEYEAAAESAEDLATEDAAVFLAAIAKGEQPPEGVVRRIAERAEKES